MMCVKPHGCVKPLLAGICVEGYQHVLLHPNPNSVISKQNPIGSLLENDLPDINGASNLRDLNFFGYSHLYSLDETLLSLIVDITCYFAGLYGGPTNCTRVNHDLCSVTD